MRYFLLLTFSIFSFADDHRISTMVVWDSVNSWSEWRESIEALSEEDRKLADKKYNAFVAMYNKNTEVVAERRWCML